MKHEDLIAKMDDLDVALSNGFGKAETIIGSIKAVRAVIELHKPDEPDFPDEWESCVECSGNGYVAMYPCQTIKAIEGAFDANL